MISANACSRLHASMIGSSFGPRHQVHLVQHEDDRALELPHDAGHEPVAAARSSPRRRRRGTTTSTSRIDSIAVSTMRTFSRCSGRWMPGVSTKIDLPAVGRSSRRGCGSAWSAACRRRWRSSCPTSRLSSVDFPALGRPTRETKPDFMARRVPGSGLRAPGPGRATAPAVSRAGLEPGAWSLEPSSRALLRCPVHDRRAFQLPHPHLVHAAALGFEHLDVQPAHLEDARRATAHGRRG